MNPNTIHKYVYIEETPTWPVRVLYALGIIAWLPVAYVALSEARNNFFFGSLLVLVIGILTLHYVSSFSLALFYRQFDLKKHLKFVTVFWSYHTEPSVDVYLPICGEDVHVLRNTWKHVSRLEYANKKVYVLDDSTEECEAHKILAEQFGFMYIERPNKGEMNKAGNLKYAYAHTDGDFIVILDADFAPHVDFIRELLPYMNDQKVGIVQSPQYFPATKEAHVRGALAHGGARTQEVFYRILQVARDRLKGAHCCGTCAIYRRAALESVGGFVQMSHSEDAYTGFDITATGWMVRYVPVILSIGISPNDAHAFFHQQHRWCLGNMHMMLDKKFWNAPIPWSVKFCYATGFLFYLHQPILVLFSFQLFWVLFFYNSSISFATALPFFPYMIWVITCMFVFYVAPFRWGYLYAISLRTFVYCHAVLNAFFGESVGWIPTNSKYMGVSAAFMQTVIGMTIYTIANLILIVIALKVGALHLLNYNYVSVQFWIFYDCTLSSLVLWQLYRTVDRVRLIKILNNRWRHFLYGIWSLKTAGTRMVIMSSMFLVVTGVPFQSGASEPLQACPVCEIGTSKSLVTTAGEAAVTSSGKISNTTKIVKAKAATYHFRKSRIRSRRTGVPR